MIIDHLKNIRLYFNLGDEFQKALEFVQNIDKNISVGEYAVSSEMKSWVYEYNTLSLESAQWESHVKHIDLQYCIRGIERIHFAHKNMLTQVSEYNESNDLVKYEDDDQYYPYVDTGNGVFAIFFPDDAHAPQVYQSEPEFIKKVVVKIPVPSSCII